MNTALPRLKCKNIGFAVDKAAVFHSEDGAIGNGFCARSAMARWPSLELGHRGDQVAAGQALEPRCGGTCNAHGAPASGLDHESM